VANPKRQRKKALRAEKQAQLEAARRRRSRIRFGISAFVVAAAVIGVIFALSSSHHPKKASASPTTSTKKSHTKATTKQHYVDGISTAADCRSFPPLNGSAATETHFSSAPPMCIDPADHYVATVKTTAGAFTITLDPKSAPRSVNVFVFLADHHFYNGSEFQRVIKDFVVQGGGPPGNPQGGPGFSFGDRFPSSTGYKLGDVAMANTGQPDSNGSQFFIVVGKQGEALPPKYSLFGRVTKGMSVVDRIEAAGASLSSGETGTPKTIYKITSISISLG